VMNKRMIVPKLICPIVSPQASSLRIVVRAMVFVVIAVTWLGPLERVYADDPAVAGPVKEGERLDARSDEYSKVFDRAINCLIEKNAGCFRALLSSFTVTQETRGPGAIDAIIRDRFVPYFSDFSKLSDRVATVPSYDAAGNSGLAFCRSFITTGGTEKFFVLYVNVESGRYVVGNLLLDTKVDQVLAMRQR